MDIFKLISMVANQITALVAGLFAKSQPDSAIMKAISAGVTAALSVANTENSAQDDMDEITEAVMAIYDALPPSNKLPFVISPDNERMYIAVMVKIVYEAATSMLDTHKQKNGFGIKSVETLETSEDVATLIDEAVKGAIETGESLLEDSETSSETDKEE